MPARVYMHVYAHVSKRVYTRVHTGLYACLYTCTCARLRSGLRALGLQVALGLPLARVRGHMNDSSRECSVTVGPRHRPSGSHE